MLDVLVVGAPANLDSIDLALNAMNITRKERARYVVPLLQEHARKEQERLDAYRATYQLTYKTKQAFWVANLLHIRIPANEVTALAAYPHIRHLELVTEQMVQPHTPLPGDRSSNMRSVNGIEPGIEAVQAPFLWNLGYSGRNTKILNFDTGIWPDHPAFEDRFVGAHRPIAEAWFPYDRQRPGDKENSHGTHTNGTCIGLDPATNDTIGIAFNAYFLATDPIVSNVADIRPLSEIAMGYQWAMNPDGDANTVQDIPDVINNSWGRSFDPIGDSAACNGFFQDVLLAVEAAGIMSFQSAGNAGPGANTVGVPAGGNATLINNFAVGAVNADIPTFPIAGFSSRGPSHCGDTGALLIKPEVVAPGVNVRSAVRTGAGVYDYDNYQGTSMAAPHVSGVALLLAEAFPQATAAEVKEALYYTAIDLGAPGEDNTYGRGMISAEAAYQYLAQLYTPAAPGAGVFDLAVQYINLEALDYTCEQTLTPVLYLEVTNPVQLNALGFTYGFEGDSVYMTGFPSGTYNPGDSLVLPAISVPQTGAVEFYAEVQWMGAMSEDDYLNNRRYARFHALPQESVPYVQSFESAGVYDLGWYVDDPDNVLTWDSARTSGLAGSSSSAVIRLFDYSPRNGQVDGLISPQIQTPNSGGLWLTYDYSYQFKAPVFNDSLRVWASTDCGTTWTLMRELGNEQLNTTAKPITNEWVPEDATDWRHDSVDLAAFVGQGNLILRFETSNGGGSYLYLDNVQVSDHPWPVGISETIEEASVRVYPNPANEVINIQFESETSGSLTVDVLDIRGVQWVSRFYESVTSGQAVSLNWGVLPAGTYFVRVSDRSGSSVHRVVK